MSARSALGAIALVGIGSCTQLPTITEAADSGPDLPSPVGDAASDSAPADGATVDAQADAADALCGAPPVPTPLCANGTVALGEVARWEGKAAVHRVADGPWLPPRVEASGRCEEAFGNASEALNFCRSYWPATNTAESLDRNVHGAAFAAIKPFRNVVCTLACAPTPADTSGGLQYRCCR